MLKKNKEDKTNLGSTSGYVPDEVAVPSSINDGDAVSKRRGEMLMVLPKSLPLRLELMHEPAVVEGALPSCKGLGVKLIYE